MGSLTCDDEEILATYLFIYFFPQKVDLEGELIWYWKVVDRKICTRDIYFEEESHQICTRSSTNPYNSYLL